MRISLEEATILALQGKLVEHLSNNIDKFDTYYIDRRKDNWYLIVDGYDKDHPEEIITNRHSRKHNAGWYARDEIRIIEKQFEDNDTRIKELNYLKNTINEDVKFAKDYNKYNEEIIKAWIQGYNEYIDDEIDKLKDDKKYYVAINGSKSDGRDSEPLFVPLKIENGRFEEAIKYYNTKEEAQKDINTLSRQEVRNYIINNCLGEFYYRLDYFEVAVFINDITSDKIIKA